MKLSSLLSLAVVLSSVSIAHAVDTIYLEGGTPAVRGTILGFTKDAIKFQQGTTERELPVNTVASISWDGETIDLKNARSSENSGNLAKAVELYTKVKEDSGGLSKDAQSDVNYLLARVKAKMAFANPAQIDAAIQGLESFRDANRDHFRYYDLLENLGKLYAAKGDAAKATATFNEMKTAPFKDYQLAAQILAADSLLQTGNIVDAQKEYQAVADFQATTPQEIIRKNEGRLGLAYCQTKQGQPDKAVEIADSVIRETESTQAVVQAKAFLRKGDALVALNKPQQAVIAYLAVDLLFASQPDLHAESLHQLSKLWTQVGKADRASDAQARLESQYPDSRWASGGN